uniref:Uncharacterized protein n=1 Tax=Rhizophora mucronata TaxID=61149 RepID=A0A2P2NVC1_RHIMU
MPPVFKIPYKSLVSWNHQYLGRVGGEEENTTEEKYMQAKTDFQ